MKWGQSVEAKEGPTAKAESWNRTSYTGGVGGGKGGEERARSKARLGARFGELTCCRLSCTLSRSTRSRRELQSRAAGAELPAFVSWRDASRSEAARTASFCRAPGKPRAFSLVFGGASSRTRSGTNPAGRRAGNGRSLRAPFLCCFSSSCRLLSGLSHFTVWFQTVLSIKLKLAMAARAHSLIHGRLRPSSPRALSFIEYISRLASERQADPVGQRPVLGCGPLLTESFSRARDFRGHFRRNLSFWIFRSFGRFFWKSPGQ